MLLLHNAGVVTMNDARHVYEDGAILIDADRIVAVGHSEDLLVAHPAAQRVDLRGRWILPGFINTHVHTSQQLGRGLADDVPLLVWLRERTWPYESNLTPHDSYVSSLLVGLELIRSGVTCFGESGGQHVDGMGRAMTELGLRAALSRSTMDETEGLPAVWNDTTDEALDKQAALFAKWHGAANGRIRYWFSLRTIFNNSDALITRTHNLADQYKTGVMMHIAEIREENDYATATRGAATVTHLHNIGALRPNLLAAHCVWMTDDEIGYFADNDVKVSHNPAAAMRVLGFARIPEMLDAGLTVSLGTDGAPCNNRMTIVDEMWLTSLIHKGRLLDPTTMPAETVLQMVTRGGARALLWEDEIGSLEAGKKADLVVVNPNTANMLPLHDPIANLVSAMQAHNIESTMADGQWLMRDGVVQVVDEAAVLDEARRCAAKIYARAGLDVPNRFSWVVK